MGVKGLWTILSPCARPIKLDTLAHKRLAVDASIWIYQFLKAVRDKDGNALRNSHIVGFFRRICKLLFFGIKPVFVFDGGAPTLKRRTIAGRKARRDGRREDAVRTAGRLLAVQMKRKAEEEDERRKRREREQHKKDEAEGWVTMPDDEAARDEPVEEPMPENPVYVEELEMTPQERKQHRKFKKQDPYHLPDLDMSIDHMGSANDPRIMSSEELAAYAAQYRDGDESSMSLYDFSKIDFSSPFFLSLPLPDQYAILSTARLRSRLRMGLSKEQLSKMFPNRLDFSRFQIERVRERNELTQRLMNLNGMNAGGDSYEALYGAGRIVGEKGREYVLVKNDGVEGGWVLGVVGRKENMIAPTRFTGEKPVPKLAPGENKSNPIDLDAEAGKISISLGGDEDNDDDEEEEFEDVPIEGLNRLPKMPSQAAEDAVDLVELERQQIQQAIYNSRKEQAGYHPRAQQVQKKKQENDNSLFIGSDEDEEWEDIDVDGPQAPSVENQMVDDDEGLRKAIALSMEESENQAKKHDDDMARAIELSQQEYLQQQRKEKGKQPSKKSAPRPHIIGIVNGESSKSAAAGLFGGLLPFESIPFDFGDSILGKKKERTDTEIEIDMGTPDDSGGGFIKESENDRTVENAEKNETEMEEEKPLPLPPWFAKTRDIRKEVELEGKAMEQERERDRELIHNELEKRPEVVVVGDSSEDENSDVEMVDVMPEVFKKGGQEKKDESDTTGDMTMGEAEIAKTVPPLRSSEKSSGVINDKITKCDTAQILPDHKPDGELEDAVEVQSPVVQSDKLRDSEGDKELERKVSDMEDEERYKAAEELTTEQLHSKNDNLPPGKDTGIVDDNVNHYLTEAEEDLSDPEEQELVSQLHAEAEEHARFASSLANSNGAPANKGSSKPILTAEEYERELTALRNQQKKDRRDADEVSMTMVSECQQLLKLFGLPYITAPMEAEAQCAELVHLGLVDGIVTDDSDCFLFGGTRVYRNMFNQAKFVECYLLGDLEREFGLDRKKLISLAHLLGSDYTDGLPGVGPVTALELLTEFSAEGGQDEEPCAPLRRFREWWDQVQHLGGVVYNDQNDSPFKKKLRKSHATKLSLPLGFPVVEVDNAYLHPEVDTDPSEFAWGIPDLDGLREFLMSTVGWSQERCDEVLVPRLTEGTQSNITRYFEGARMKEPGKSKRMDKAMKRLHQIVKKTTVGRDEGSGGEGHEEGMTAPLSTPTSTRGRGSRRGGARERTTGNKRQRKARNVASSSSSFSGSDGENGIDGTEEGHTEDGSADEEVIEVDGPAAASGRKRKAACTGRGGKQPGGTRGMKRGRGRGSSMIH
ncbi:hypothetical protein BDZ91DRAFT_721388 [Kalaharituber pfeilii]|nr:hypothetical protein BDZ91DRAFT_721388 [Kalaharituber pfeilii]